MCHPPSLAVAMPHRLYEESLVHQGQGDSSWEAVNGVHKPPFYYFVVAMDTLRNYYSYTRCGLNVQSADELVTCVSTVCEEESYLI